MRSSTARAKEFFEMRATNKPAESETLFNKDRERKCAVLTAVWAGQ